MPVAAAEHTIETTRDTLPHTLEVALHVAAFVAVLLGVAIRMRLYWAPDALDTDEQLLALNLLTRSMRGFWEPLELGQSAAPLFLVAAKAGTAMMGVSEASLRLGPMLAGCLALPALWLLGRRLLTPEETLFAVTLLAVAHAHVFYSSFFKPYTTDALVTIALALAAVAVLKRPTVRRYVVLGVASAACLLLSTTAVFTVGGVGLGMLGAAARRRSVPMLMTVVGLAALWGTVILWLMHSSHADLGDASTPAAKFMGNYWQNYFLFRGPWGIRLSIKHTASSLLDTLFLGVPHFMESPSFLTVVMAGGVALGLLACTRRHGIEIGVLFAAPLALLLFASAMRRYPTATRLVLFSAPISALGLAAGFSWTLSCVRRSWRIGVMAVVAAVLAVRGAAPLTYPWSSAQRAERRTLVKTTAARTRSGTPVYLFPASVPAWLVFATDWTGVDSPTTRRLIQAVDLDGPATFFRPMRSLIGFLPAVTDAELTMPWGQGTVLVGRTSGMGGRNRSPVTLDAGWAMHEAERIRRAGSCVDVLLIDSYPAERAALESALFAARGLIEDRRTTERDLAYRVCFSSNH